MASAVSYPGQDVSSAVAGWISSGTSHYRVESLLGQGTFGTVAKCRRMVDGKTVAIKMMKNEGSLINSACAEVTALLQLTSLDPDLCNLVRWYQVFTYQGYNCLEFEHLDKSLFDFMKKRHFRPLRPKEIRPIVQQLATSLLHLKDVGMVHADLKMENVMLVDHVREPYRVKLIDFGLASKTSSGLLGSYIQTRPYRSPEIILGLPFTEAIDMWSLGCLAATLYLGDLLYPGMSEYDMMRYIVDTQGQPPGDMLDFGLKTGSFFQKDKRSGTWKLKTPKQFKKETGIQSEETRRKKLNSLYDLLHTQKPKKSADKSAELNDMLMFVDLIDQMLKLDPAKRITPRQVLEHPFITMRNMDRDSAYGRSCFEMMEHCQKTTLASDWCVKDVSGSVQQPSSGSTHPVQQNLPSSAERSSLSQPHRVYRHTCSGTQETSTVKAVRKRKIDDEDGTMSENPHLAKRIKSSRPTAQDSSSAETKSQSRSDLKRRAPDDEEQEDSRTRGRQKRVKSSRHSKKTKSRSRSDLRRRAPDDEEQEDSRTRGRQKRVKSSRHSKKTKSRSRSDLRRRAPDDEEQEDSRTRGRQKRVKSSRHSKKTKSRSRSDLRRRAPDDEEQEDSRTRGRQKRVKSSRHSKKTKSRSRSDLRRREPDGDVRHDNSTSDFRPREERKRSAERVPRNGNHQKKTLPSDSGVAVRRSVHPSCPAGPPLFC